MNTEPSSTVKPILSQVRAYIQDAILPLEAEYLSEINTDGRWQQSTRQKEILDQPWPRLKMYLGSLGQRFQQHKAVVLCFLKAI